MAARVCPQCMKGISAGIATAFSDGMECPHCQARLEVSSVSRMPAVYIALIAAALVYKLASGASGILAPALAELYAILAYGFVSAIILMFMADLQFAPAALAAPETPPAGHGHGGDHH